MNRRRTLIGMLVAMAILVGAPAAWAAVQVRTASTAVVSQTGTLRFWDMTTGTLTTWDSSTEWNAGTHTNTNATATPGTLTLKPAGATPPGTRPWWNTSWSTRRCFTVAGTGTALTNQKISLTFDSATDISNGWMLASGADIRVIANDNTTVLTHSLVSGINTATTNVAALANIPAVGTTVCLYSGNPSATSTSTTITSTIFIDTGTGAGAAPGGWLDDTAIATWVSGTVTTTLTTAGAITVSGSATGVPAAVFSNATTWAAVSGNPGPLTYSIPGFTASTPATIIAYFSESWDTTRRFRVLVNGVATADTNFQIATTAGGSNIGIARTYATTVGAGGTLTLGLDKIGNGSNRDPLISGFSVTGVNSLASFTGVSSATEGLYATSGTWDSQVITASSATAIYAAVYSDSLAPTLSGATYQIASSASASGPWNYVGPGGTAATTFVGGQEATPTSIDGFAFARIRVTMTTSTRLASPSIGILSMRGGLSELARTAGGRSNQTAATLPTVLRNDGSWVASEISTYPGSSPNRAIDGNTNGDYFAASSVSHTNAATVGQWWQVDTGRIQPISAVRLWNRTDCCDTRATNITVFAADVPFLSPPSTTPGVTSYTYTGVVGRPTQIAVGRSARYLRVQLDTANYLHLAEVQLVAPVALLTKITATESGLTALSDNLIHEATTGAALTSNIRLGASSQIRLNAGVLSLAGTAITHTNAGMIISATREVTGATATQDFVFRAIWTSEQLRIERKMGVVWP
jgi:hypothetical protein